MSLIVFYPFLNLTQAHLLKVTAQYSTAVVLFLCNMSLSVVFRTRSLQGKLAVVECVQSFCEVFELRVALPPCGAARVAFLERNSYTRPSRECVFNEFT